MADEERGGKLHIDSDWKAEAQREKERLAQEEADADASGIPANAAFLEIVNLIAMQAVVGLGGLAGPGGERIPADPRIAKYHIDMLDILDQKTKGNLTADEKKVLDAVIYELRMRFVEAFSAGPKPEIGGLSPNP